MPHALLQQIRVNHDPLRRVIPYMVRCCRALGVDRSPLSAAWCAVQYMDRIYVKHQNKAPVTQLGLDLWRDCVVRRRGIRERMLAMLLDLIHRERTGDIIDRALLRAITTVRPCHPVVDASTWLMYSQTCTQAGVTEPA